MSKKYPRRCFVNQIENIKFVFRITNIIVCDLDDTLITVFPTDIPYYEFSHKLCPFDFIKAMMSAVPTHR
jgi:hypothetical protein